MTIIATISIAAPAFVSREELRTTSNAVILDRVIANDTSMLSYLWVPADERTEYVTATTEDETVRSGTVVDVVDQEALLRIEWETPTDDVYRVFARSGWTVIGGIGTKDAWTYRLRFDDQEMLSTFYRECEDANVSITIDDVYTLDQPDELATLTHAQLETLQLALEEGYYDVPRQINLTEIADSIGVSDTAASQRMRRGLKKILTTLFEDSTPAAATGGNPNVLDVERESERS